MKYQEIYDEYTSLINRYSLVRFELQSSPKGNLVKKRISNKEYHYLQYSSHGKKKTEYIREQNVETVRLKLIRCVRLRKEMETIGADLLRLEQAARILDDKLSRMLYFLRQCADMDALPLEKRKDALAFAAAMTSLEGVSARAETDQNLKAWAVGEKAFADFYIPILQSYGVMESAYEK